jgi:hypothetical protein
MSSEENVSPSLGTKAVNLAKFSLDLIKYIHKTGGSVLRTPDDAYAKRLRTCRECPKYMEIQNECSECGCYIPAKARVILDSCPLDKWDTIDESEWEDKFSEIKIELDINEEYK